VAQNGAGDAIQTVEKVLAQRIRAKKKELLQYQAEREEAERREATCLTEISEMELAVSVFRKAFGLESQAPTTAGLDRLKLRTQTVRQSCIEIMKGSGGRAKVTDITRALIGAGKLRNYRGGYATVTKTLDRDDRFRRVGKGEFELVEGQAPLIP